MASLKTKTRRRMASLKTKTRDLIMYRKQIFLIPAAAVLLSLPAFPQESGLYRNEFTAQALGSFLKTTGDNGSQQSATNSGGVLGSYRLFFNSYNGVEVDYGYTLNTQTYIMPTASIGVKSYSHEISGAYVIRKPLKRWSPFALAGAGGLIFDPKDTPGVNSQARAAFVYGVGADVTLSRHWYLRAEYRGLVYNSPTWNLQGLSGADRVTHLAEPSIGFGYRF
jgi:opacity protein-like surface antigen